MYSVCTHGKKAKAIKIRHHHGGNDGKRWQKKCIFTKGRFIENHSRWIWFWSILLPNKKVMLIFHLGAVLCFFYSLLFGFPHKCVVVTKGSPLFLYRNYQQVNKCRKKCVALQKKMENIIANKNGEDGFHRQC